MHFYHKTNYNKKINLLFLVFLGKNSLFFIKTMNKYKALEVENYKFAKNEELLSSGFIAHIEQKLMIWREELVVESENTVTHMQDDVTKVADINDRATLEEEFSLELRTRDRERKLIEKIDKTLRSIELNEYGYCKTCDVEINHQRLEARPTADQCIDCKTISEKREL